MPHAASVSVAAQRFFDVFREHGVQTTQIPRLLPDVRLEDLQSSAHIVKVLTPELIDKVAKMFGVRVEWLEGHSETIYDYVWTYKDPTRLLDHFCTVWKSHHYHFNADFPLRVLTDTKQLDRREAFAQILVPVLVEPIITLGEEAIYRYHVYRDGYDWAHSPARLELKAIARIIFKTTGLPIPLYPIQRKDIKALIEGRRIPLSLLRGLITNPSFEDYAIGEEESAVAKETDELPRVIERMAKLGLDTYDLHAIDCPEPAPQLAPAAPPEAPSAKSGKRQANQEIWSRVMAAASANWDLEPDLPIQEVARRVKKRLAVPFMEDAIRKRIRQIAPENIKGKPGRKPKK